MTIKQQGGVFGRNPTFNNVDVEGNISLPDSSNINVGSSDDLQIYHNGTSSFVANLTGDLILRNSADDKDIYLQTDNGSGGSVSYLQADGSTGSINLRHYGNIKLATDTNGVAVTGNVILDSGSGIDFSATAGTGTSELFDDYEEGTWTATVGCTGNATTTTTVTGYYTKIGRQVTVSFRSLNDIDTTGLSGFLSISLPFTCVSGTTAGFIGALIWDSLTYPAGVSVIFPYTANGASTILFATGGSVIADSLLDVSAVTSGTTDLTYATLTYFTA